MNPDTRRDCAIFACDANHLGFAHAAASRLAEVEPERCYDIAIATPTPEALPEDCWAGPILPIRIDVSAIPPIEHPAEHITIGTFYRHLLPGLLRERYRQLFYMDTDTWMARPGLGALLERAGGRHAVAAGPSFGYAPELWGGRAAMPEERRTYLEDLVGPEGRLFQAGVLLIGTDGYVAEDLGRRVITWAAENHEALVRFKLGDQVALNAVYHERIVPLDPGWNWHGPAWLEKGLVDSYEPHLLHFAGKRKQWQKGSDPLHEMVHADLSPRLAKAIPGFEAAPVRRSIHWWRENPLTGIAPLDTLHLRYRRWREAHKLRARSAGSSVERMRALAATCELR